VSYLAIARKYRPATFDEIVGQEHVTRTLRNALERGRIHHAYLFSGARGVGKTTAARALARSLNCKEGPTATPCGVCTSCVEIAAGNSPDLIEIDGASNNSVDDIRDLRETVRYAPTLGKHKIYLIDEVHMLSKGAFNALLKTLEEPPPHVVFIFATTESNKIPETILSRVQRFDFKRIPVIGVAQRLREIADKEGVVLNDSGLRLIARAGDGSMRDAQSLLDQVISYGTSPITDEQVVEALGLIDRKILYDMLDAIVTGKPDVALEIIDRVYSYGFELSEFTSEMLEVLRNATFARLSPSSRKFIDIAPDELERLIALTDGADVDALDRAFAAMLEVHDQVSRASRPRVVLEMAVARLANVRPVQPIPVLLGRLEELERRLRSGGAQGPVGGLRPSPRAPRSAFSEPAGGRDDRVAPGPSVPATPGRPQTAPSAPRASAAVPDLGPEPPLEAIAQRAGGSPRADVDRPQEGQHGPAESWSDAEDDAPPLHPAPADGPVPEATWQAFAAAARAMGADAITKGEPSFRDGGLRLAYRGGLAGPQARRLAELPGVRAALAQAFPGCRGVTIVVQNEDERERDALLQDARQHPVIKRLIEQYGGEIGKIGRG
jgi:DNA polymerase-3 subunit gamma/tau